MPKKGGRTTPQERVFTDALVARGDPRVAAEIAGYSNPETNGYKVAARPAIANEVARRVLERIQNELLPYAFEAHLKLLTEKGVPHGARVQAVKLAYDRALGDQDKLNGKEAHEMTAAELADEIARLKRQQARADAADVVAESVDQAPAADVFG